MHARCCGITFVGIGMLLLEAIVADSAGATLADVEDMPRRRRLIAVSRRQRSLLRARQVSAVVAEQFLRSLFSFSRYLRAVMRRRGSIAVHCRWTTVSAPRAADGRVAIVAFEPILAERAEACRYCEHARFARWYSSGRIAQIPLILPSRSRRRCGGLSPPRRQSGRRRSSVACHGVPHGPGRSRSGRSK